MRILWLSWKSITHPDAGGAEIVGHENAKALVAAGHSVTWISLAPLSLRASHFFHIFQSKNERAVISPLDVEKDGVQYPYIGNRILMHTGLFHLLVFINYIINWRKHFDFVIDEIHGPPLLTPLYVRKPSLTVIHEVAGEIWRKTIPFPLSTLMEKVVEPLFFRAYRKQPMLIGAETTKADLIQLGIPEKNIFFVPYGVEGPPKETTYPKETVPTLIFLSALRPMKGFDRVYRAFKKIRQHNAQVRLWVVGDDNTEHAKHMKELIAQDFPSQSPITFYGKVSQEKKFELLQRAHILVHGSYKEGWGLVVIEANLVGTPAVVFDAAGLRDSVKHSQTGYLCQNEDEFVQRVSSLLRQNNSEYMLLAQNAINWSKQFSWSTTTKAFTVLVTKLYSKNEKAQHS